MATPGSVRFSGPARGILLLLCVLLPLFPWSPSTQPGGFSLTLDLDVADGDQGVFSLDLQPDKPVSIQIFGADIEGATSVSAQLRFDVSQISYEGFDPGDALPDADVAVQQDTTTIRIGIAALTGLATASSGLIGTLRIRTTAAFSDVEIWLVEAELTRGGRTETISPAVGVVLLAAAPPSPDFDGNGMVGFSDFLALAGAFGTSRGDEKYVSAYDLNGDGAIAFDDFLIFAGSFGEEANRVPVFGVASPVTRTVDENTAAGEPIGDPIAATDADGDSLTYRLSGVHADGFEIDAATGQLLTGAGTTYDHEARDRYSVTVRAGDGNEGRARVAVNVAVADVDEPPSAPPDSVAVAPRDSALSVTWLAAMDEAGKPPVSGYEVGHKQADAEAWPKGLLLAEGRTDTSVALAGLANDRAYHVRVRTVNEEGASPWSAPVAVAPTAGPRPRGAVRDLRVNVDSVAQANLAGLFTRPALGMLTYGATSSNEAVATVAVADTLASVRGVAAGRATITATAGDAHGNSAQTTFFVIVTGTSPPPGSGGGGGGPVGPIGPFVPPPPPPPTQPPVNNRPPAFDDGASTSRTVAENTPARRPIQHPVRATDPDGHRVTYGLSGPDSASFSVDAGSGQLRTLAGVTYDFEVNNRYSVVLEGSDPFGESAAIDVTVHVADVDEPPGTPERPLVQPASTTSLAVTWDPPDNTGPDITDYDVRYRKSGNFVPHTHDGDGAATTIPDLEVNTRYEVQVRASNEEDTGGWSPSGFGTTSANLPPVFDEGGSATRSLEENTPPDRNVGDPLRAADPENAAVTYSLSRGDVESFNIHADTGQLLTRTGVVYDFETKDRYSVTVEAQDELGGRAILPVTVNVTDDDGEAPDTPAKPTVTASTSNSLSIRWTAPVNTGPAIIDYDVQFREGTTGSFSPWAHNGPGTSTTITSLTADTDCQVQVLARSPEGVSLWSESVDARTSANRAPTFNEGVSATRSFAENTTGVNDVGNPITARDSDGGTPEYSLSGADAASFTIDSADGQLQTVSGATYDYEEKSTYEVTVRVEDGQGGSNTIAVRINLTDQQEKPGAPDAPGVSPASSTSLAVTWDEPDNTGPDVNDYDVQYRQGDSGGFRSWTHNGAERGATITALVPDSAYQVQVLARSPEGASDWSESGTGTTHPNELPVFTDGSSATRAMAENTTGVKDVGDPVSATDAERTTLTYALEGAHADSFSIDARSGQIRTRSGRTYDFEALSRYSVVVKATDGHGGESDIPVSVVLTDLNEAPVFSGDATLEAAENQAFAGTVAAGDLDRDDVITGYSVTGGSDRSQFEINSAGALTFRDAPDFERPADAGANNGYVVQVTATGGSGARALTAAQTITVTVADENEPPRLTSADSFAVREHVLLAGRLAARDEDGDDGVTGYAVAGGADGDDFEIKNTRELHFKDDPDFERPADAGGDNEYTVDVEVTGGVDARALTTTQTVTVTVEDDVEPPGRPAPPVVSDTTESSLTVRWDEPANTGPDVTNYFLQYRDSGSFTADPDSASTRTRTIAGLRPARTYQFRVQAKNDDGRGPWSNIGSGTTLTAPGISSVAFTSAPASGQNNTYRKDDVIDVTVTFNEAVTVTGKPQVDLTIGSTVRKADYESGSTTAQLVFQYVVADSDEDVDGAGIAENGLTLNGGSIRRTGAAINADLMHSARNNQSRHRVDGKAPALTDAEANGDELVLVFGEQIDADPKPAGADFAVNADDSTLTVTAVTMRASQVELTLDPVVTAGQTVTLAYAPGTNPIRDLAQNPAAALTNLTIRNATQGGTLGVCGRTRQVRGAIMVAADVGACGDVTADHLSAITRLSLDGLFVTTLKAGDFAGLSALETLSLGENLLATLPQDIFTGLSALEGLNLQGNNLAVLDSSLFSGLTNLETLLLDGNQLDSLDTGLFSNLSALRVLDLAANRLSDLDANTFSSLTALEDLGLAVNRLSDLDANTFSSLTALEDLDLRINQLSNLDANVFTSLSTLKVLDLGFNQLSNLDANVFSSLSALNVLGIRGNKLSSVDAGIFSGLADLKTLRMDENSLTSLPDSLFEGLTSLAVLRTEKNTVNPLPVNVSLERVASGRFRAKVHTGAPFDMALPIEVVNGAIDGGAGSIEISQGSLESRAVTVSRTTGTTAPVTVDVGVFPDLPGTDRGYAFVLSGDLPLEVIQGLPEVHIYPAALSVAVGDSNAYAVALNSMPTMDVTVAVNVPAGSDISVTPTERTFAADTFDMSQTVTVIADTAATANDVITLSHVVSGGDYQNVSADDVSVTIVDATTGNEGPTFSSAGAYDVEENETSVGVVVAADDDASDYVTGYEITGGAQQAQFEITSGGALTFVTAPDYERPAVSGNRYAVVVTAASGIGARERTASQTILVSVTDVDEPPGRPSAPTLDLSLAAFRSIGVSSGRRPLANTGPDITEWRIRYRIGNTGDFISFSPDPEPDWTAPNWEARIGKLARGQTYEVQVRAENDEGVSEWSPSAEAAVPNQAPVAEGTFEDLTLPVEGAVEVLSAGDVFDDPESDGLTYSASSGDSSIVSVRVINTEVLLDPGSAGNTRITVTASDPWGASGSETFDVTVRTPTLSDPSLSISGNLFTLEFTEDFAAGETRAYQLRIRQKEPIGGWGRACFTATNDENNARSVTVIMQSLVSDYFEPGNTYEADYVYLGADCDVSPTGLRSAAAEATVPGTPEFNIQLVYAGDAPAPRVRTALEAAAARWERVIAQDVPNHRVSAGNRGRLEAFYPGTAAPEVVDDLAIYVEVIEIDGARGTLGRAGLMMWRTPSALPVVSYIDLDRDDLGTLSDDKLEALVLHEIGHTLGFGVQPWKAHNLLENPSLDVNRDRIVPAPDTHFSGANAVAAFNAAGGSGYTGEKVPVENALGGTGSLDSHWRESVMASELMTPRLGLGTNPLSAITIQSLADIGYTVDANRADAYTLPSAVTSKLATRPDGLILQNCVVTHPEAGPDRSDPFILNLRRVVREGEMSNSH